MTKTKRATPLALQSRLSDEVLPRTQAKRRLTKLLQERGLGRGESLAPTLWLTAEASPFVLHFLVREDAALLNIDRFLRDVWMECCGHLSLFQYRPKEGRRIIYTADPEEEVPNDKNPFLQDLTPEQRKAYLSLPTPRRPLEKPLDISVSEAFAGDISLEYEYDMGTTTRCKLKVVARLETAWPKKKAVRLIARNVRPNWRCRECGEAATKLCTMGECWDGSYATFCNEHAAAHAKKLHPREGGDWMMEALSNSPRDPSCGYHEAPGDEDAYVWN